VYSADLLYTSNRGGTISFDVNGESKTGPLTIATTYNAADPIAWRQWHHWNVAMGIAKFKLPAGKNVPHCSYPYRRADEPGNAELQGGTVIPAGVDFSLLFGGAGKRNRDAEGGLLRLDSSR